MADTEVIIRGGSTVVRPRASSAKRITLDRRTVVDIANNRPKTVVQPSTSPMVVQDKSTTVKTGAGMGVQGPPGSTDAAVKIYPAGEPISALRGVKVVGGLVYYADGMNVADAGLVTGLSQTAGSNIGDPVAVRTDGPLVDAVWTWSPGPVFVGFNGVLTQSPAGLAFVCDIGRAVSATEIVVDVQTPFVRN